MSSIAIPGILLLLTFLVTLIAGRWHVAAAFVIGSLPAALVAALSGPVITNPLTWLILLAIWLPSMIGALIGAGLAMLVHSRRRRA